MLLRRRLRAGILLYALFISAVFALLLQFYVQRVQGTRLVQTAQYQQARASLMAELTKTIADKEQGELSFDQGSSSYVQTANKLSVTVQLTTGKTYQYTFVRQKPEQADATKTSSESLQSQSSSGKEQTSATESSSSSSQVNQSPLDRTVTEKSDAP